MVVLGHKLTWFIKAIQRALRMAGLSRWHASCWAEAVRQVKPGECMDTNRHASQQDQMQNQTLLEGLFQLAITEGADSEDLALIDQEVYARLQDTYPPSP